MGSKKKALKRGSVDIDRVHRKAPTIVVYSPRNVTAHIGHDSTEAVNHPAHYGGDTVYEVIKVLEAWGLHNCAYLFQVVKYVARAGKKDPTKEIEDLQKAKFYLEKKILNLQLKYALKIVKS